MNGKGSKRRPGDARKYAEGWVRIFGKRTERCDVVPCSFLKAECTSPKACNIAGCVRVPDIGGW